jgi:hypothetical protein
MSIERRIKRHILFNNIENYLQFNAFDAFTFDDKRVTSIVITLNIMNIVHNKRFARNLFRSQSKT